MWIYYANVLADILEKTMPALAPTLLETVHLLYTRMDQMDVAAADRLAEWLGFHMVGAPV
jgi:hypothetical protein